MVIVTRLEPYNDAAGNEIRYAGPAVEGVRIKIRGSRNRLVVSRRARLGTLRIDFDNDDGLVRIGASRGVPAFSAAIRVGQDSEVIVGANVSTTSIVAMSAVEGAAIHLGDDVMIASDNELRADDGHPIFDVRTGRRVNVSRSIVVGDHVWLARRAVCLGGAFVGSGSVVGYGAIVTGQFPNNVVLAGVPAKVVRRDIAWERPHLSLQAPFYKPDASTIDPTEGAWSLTDDDVPRVAPTRAGVRRAQRWRRRLGVALRRAGAGRAGGRTE